uniref:Protein Vpr n=1 Tax=Human immunodeficiency virus type 1 TaxID=11676 RepID=Q1M085_HV1|nr:vpr protein [Human immunodeficiency virus 1]
MKQAPEGGPQRAPYNKWTLKLLKKLKNKAVRHFPRPWLHGLRQFIYDNYGDTWEGVKAIIKILQQLLFVHFRIGCQHSRISIIPGKKSRNKSSRS